MFEFCTLICCMDGRFNMTANEYIRVKFGYVYIDTITDAGPACKLLEEDYLKSIEDKIRLSLQKHNSSHVFVTGHHDCVGCPVDDDTHISYIKDAVGKIKEEFDHMRVTGIFIDDDFNTTVIKDLT